MWQHSALGLALVTVVVTPCAVEWVSLIGGLHVHGLHHSVLYYPGLSCLAWLLLAISFWRCDHWTKLTTVTLALWAVGLVFPFCGHFLGWTRDGTADPYGIHSQLPIAMVFALILNAILAGFPVLILGGLASFRRFVPFRRAARGLCAKCCHQLMIDQDICPECGTRRWRAPSHEPRIARRIMGALAVGCLIPPLIATVILEIEEVAFARGAEAAATAGENEFERTSLFDGRMWWRRDGSKTPAHFGGGFGSFRD
jgi:hypothetical protein